MIGYASNPSRLEDLAIAQFEISPLAEGPIASSQSTPNPQLERLHAIFTSGRLFHDPRVPGWMGYMARIQAAFDAMWAGEKSPAAALGELELETRKWKA